MLFVPEEGTVYVIGLTVLPLAVVFLNLYTLIPSSELSLSAPTI